MQPGRTTPLSPSEVEQAFANAPFKNDQCAYWQDSDGNFEHREGDLPAEVYADGSMNWAQYAEYCRYGDLPSQVTADGKQVWWVGRIWHRGGGLPAIIYPDGRMEWWVDDIKTGDQDNPPPGAVFPGQLTKSAGKK